MARLISIIVLLFCMQAHSEEDNKNNFSHAINQALRLGQLRSATKDDVILWIWKQKDVNPSVIEKLNIDTGKIDTTGVYVVLSNQFNIPKATKPSDSAIFYIQKGVKFPTGNIGNSVFYDFNTLKCVGVDCNKLYF